MSLTLPFDIESQLGSERCILYVELKRFYVSQHTTEKPLVILRDGHVLDADLKNRRCKLFPGLTDRAARSMLHDGDFLPWNPEDYVQRQKEWLDVCMQFSDVIEPADQHSAFLDFSLYPDPIAIAEELVRELTKRTQLAMSIGMAPSKWVATLATDDGGRALRNPAAFVGRLPVSMLLPVPEADRERLKFLGYFKIGQVATIPFEILAEQFGMTAYTIQQAANGSGNEAVQPLYPPDSYSDRVVFPEAVESSETILEVCRKWSQRIGEALANRSVEGANLRLTLEDEDGALRVATRKFSKPVRCFRTAYMALRLMLEEMMDRPILSLRLLISELKRVRAYQTDFQLDKSNRRVESALNHIRNVFGDGSVQLGNQIDEPRRIRVLREWKHATGWQ